MKRAYVTATSGALTAAFVLGQQFLIGQARAGVAAGEARQAANPAESRAPQVPLKGKIERVRIHGQSLAGNLTRPAGTRSSTSCTGTTARTSTTWI